jgi:hypothetical protein
VEHNILLLDEVAPFHLEQGIVLEDILESDTSLHEYLHVEAALDDQTAEVTLLQGLLENVLFYSVHRDQAVNVHGLSLPDTMATILGLFIHGWVPISVIEDNAVCTCQVNTYTSTARGGDETEDFFVQVKLIYKSLPHFYLD